MSLMTSFAMDCIISPALNELEEPLQFKVSLRLLGGVWDKTHLLVRKPQFHLAVIEVLAFNDRGHMMPSLSSHPPLLKASSFLLLLLLCSIAAALSEL